MKYSIFRSILIGILFGLLTFIAPTLILILLIIGAIFKLSGKRRRWHKGQYHNYKVAFADKIRNMDEAEFADFKSNMNTNYCH